MILILCVIFGTRILQCTVFYVSDRDYILRNYKTQPCKRTSSSTSRSCRQGFACPLYHNAKDRRRSPYASTYRNTPCPSVKLADEWCEPAVCQEGDKCGYCHTRVEQQFHPDVSWLFNEKQNGIQLNPPDSYR